MSKITCVSALRNLIGSPSEMVPHKIHRELNARAIGFIGKSPMLMLSTADAAGRATVSPKGDPAGFVHVEDSRTLLVIRVRVTECYFHCAKAFLRSDLWKPETWSQKMTISFGEEIAESGGIGRELIPEFDHAVAGRYKTDL